MQCQQLETSLSLKTLWVKTTAATAREEIAGGSRESPWPFRQDTDPDCFDPVRDRNLGNDLDGFLLLLSWGTDIACTSSAQADGP